jgi:hypothetical protein
VTPKAMAEGKATNMAANPPQTSPEKFALLKVIPIKV